MTGFGDRKFNARPDTVDFRDRMYQPSLREVPPQLELDRYRRFGVPVLDQGAEGACTGFGLATMANYLLRRRESDPDVTLTSARMFYEMARRYDEWEGEDYDGSSARGAMKGWHKHGVCTEDLWSYKPGRKGDLNPERIADAAARPLGAYYRVNHKELVSIHTALAEIGVVYVTGVVHEGWEQPDPKTGIITPRSPSTKSLGGHAFALVAYDHRGFWIQNSWGPDWGKDGFALLTYEDWLSSANDAWVAQLGVPVTVGTKTESLEDFTDEVQPHVYTFQDMRPHVIAIGDDGELATTGTYRNTAREIESLVAQFETNTADWPTRRVVMYAHGGLVPASTAVRQGARMRTQFLDRDIYPLFFIWNTDWFSTLKNMIDDLFERWSAEAPAGGAFDFLQDRVDDLLESAARNTGLAKAGWSEIKENGIRASSRVDGGARVLANALGASHKRAPFEIHLVGHSAGSILLAGLASYLGTGESHSGPVRGKGLGLTIDSCHLWAPAATETLFKETYAALAGRNKIDRMTIFALRDQFERDDSAGPYQKSILYLVSNALEARARIPLWRPDGESLSGMEKFLTKGGSQMATLKDKGKLDYVISPTREGAAQHSSAKATSHVGFSSDMATLEATIARILGTNRTLAPTVPETAIKAFDEQAAAAS